MKAKKLDRHIPVVFHVIDSLDVSGGAERQLVTNLRSFNRNLMTHEVITIRRSATSIAGELQGVTPITALFADGEKVTRPRVISRLRRQVKLRSPALIHAALPDAGLASRVVGRLEGVPVVESLVNISHEKIRTTDNPAVTPLKLKAHTTLDRVTMKGEVGFHAVSAAVADSWTRVVGLDRSTIRVIPRGVEIDRVHMTAEAKLANRASVRGEFGFPPNAPLVISVGRVEPQKGHIYLIRAAASLQLSNRDLRVLIVGRSGHASQAVQRAIQDLGLEETVILTGPRRDIGRLLSAADIFAFPSLFEGNGGNAMIEAMAAELPIVTTNEAPMTDLIPSSRFGLLIPRTDSAALAESLDSLLTDASLRAELGRSAADRAMDFRSPELIAAEYEDWYIELLST